jgi:hypothetical protein
MSAKIENGMKVLLNLPEPEWKKIQEEGRQYNLSGAALIRMLIAKHLKEKEAGDGTTRLI